MKLSIILPCYNGAATIAQQMEALCRQSWDGGEWEVIVSNNGSTDNSMDIVEQYRHRLPNLQIVSAYTPPGPRLGVSHSYNVGFEAATGDAFVLCESDDEVGEGWLQSMGDALRQHEFVVAQMEYHKLNPAWMLRQVGKNPQELTIPKLTFYPFLQYAWGCSFGLRRRVYEKLGGFNSNVKYACDSDYCFKAQCAGIDIQLVPGAVIHYRLRGSLKALFKQQRNWGEEFMWLARCYGAPTAKFSVIRKSISVAQEGLKGLTLFPAYWLGLPNSRSNLYMWLKGFAFHVGEIKGLGRPIVPAMQPPTSLKVASPA
jgi:glycosyltransferase involved in cell wall biosynthesis